MAASEFAVTRVPVSLRLPVAVVERIEGCARENGISKTDAFLHFLEKGMEADALSQQLEGIRTELGSLRKAMEEGLSARKDELESVRLAVREAACRFPAIKRAYLFGSFARGDFNEGSDVDVRIERDSEGSFNLRDLAQFASLIEHATGREVDVISSRVVRDANLAASIEREKVLVYEREA